ncbi:unnamed protein product [Sphagnum troendelagicum]
MASLTDLYKECQVVVRTLSSQSGKVKFNKSLWSLLTNEYVASLTFLDNYIFREDGSIDLPCKTALVELRRIMSCGQLLVTQWTQKDWWMSVITSSDSASLDKTVILHLREFLACVNVLVQMKTNMAYGPALDSLDSSAQQACRTDIEGLILSMKQYRRGKMFSSKFEKLAKHLSEKLEAKISNHEYPYTIDFPLDVQISYKDCLGDGSSGTVYKCTFLGVTAAAKVWKTNRIDKKAAEKEASLFSKLRHPNVAQFIGYGVKESQPVIVSELMSTNLRTYLDEKKKNAGERPPLPLLVAMNILLQIAEAMNYLHENAVMHRDLKASNVLINVLEGPDGQLSLSYEQVKLTDFGESKLKLHDSGYTTPMVGTTRWRAPEVFEVEENREKYTKSADVYSFSMLCFEVLTGDVPFEDKPVRTLLQSIRDGVRPQLPDADYCPDYLSALIEKCWATTAVDRPQFPIICQLLVDYKARVLMHPYDQEDVPPDYPQTLQAVDAADTVCSTMASLTDLYKECQVVVRTLSSQSGKVKFNKSLWSLLTNEYVASLTFLDNYIFREDGSIDLPCKTALVELRRIMSCGQLLVTQWTQKDWWMSVITSSDSASLDKTVILHLREFLACVNVLVQMKTNMAYGPALDSLDSSAQQACRTDIEGLILSMKQYRRAAKVWRTNRVNKEAAEKEAGLLSKLRHPNVAQFIGYGVKESQRVIVSELMSTDLRRYLDEKKKNAGEGPPLPLLVAMNILLQIAEAMNYLHENAVMHLDLKAKKVLINVLEGPGGQPSLSSVQVKLIGFGDSELELHDSQYTTPMVGTTRWRAPEVYEVEENREKYTKSADVYSFSMLCFEVLTGDVPFKDEKLSTLLESIHKGVRPQLPDVEYCPDYLSALIKKCWATNAVERPQFPVILQLLMDYKARVLKHPYWGEDVPPDSSQESQTGYCRHS